MLYMKYAIKIDIYTDDLIVSIDGNKHVELIKYNKENYDEVKGHVFLISIIIARYNWFQFTLGH